MAIVDASDDSFEQDVLKSTQPVLVDFWAQWCGPCKALAPTLVELDQEIGTKVKVVKVDIDRNRQVASQYGVRSIPTLILFDKGQAISTKVGGMPKSKLQEWIQQTVKV